MNYSVKFVLIIGLVAVASFFTASLVIPEKSAVAPSRKSAQKRMTPPPNFDGSGDILVVVADGKPTDKPIKVSDAGPSPTDLMAPAPAAAPAAVKTPPVDVMKGAPAVGAVATAEAKAAPQAAKTPPPPPLPPPPPPPPPAATPNNIKAATFSPKVDTAAGEPFASPNAARILSKSAPPNTMADRLNPAAPPPPPPTATAANTKTQTPAATAVPVATIAVAQPDTARRRKPDPNAPLGYKLATAVVCAGVENRAPTGVGDRFSKEAGAVYYFTHLVGATDSAAVMHRWYREGKLIQTSILEIKSPNWRTHSKRNLTTVEEPAGNWRVEVVDRKSGKVLESAAFVVD